VALTIPRSCYSLHLFLSGSNYSSVPFPNSFQRHLVIFKIIHSFKVNQQVTQILPNKCIHKNFTKHTQSLPYNKKIIIKLPHDSILSSHNWVVWKKTLKHVFFHNTFAFVACLALPTFYALASLTSSRFNMVINWNEKQSSSKLLALIEWKKGGGEHYKRHTPIKQKVHR